MSADLSASITHDTVVAISIATKLRDESQSFATQDRALYSFLQLHPDKTFDDLYSHENNRDKFKNVDKTGILMRDFKPHVYFNENGGENRWMVAFGKAEMLDVQSGMQLGLCTLTEVLRQTDELIAHTSEEELAGIDAIPLVYPHFEFVGGGKDPAPVLRPEKSLYIFVTKDQYQQLHQVVEDFLSPENKMKA
ncbi:MAG: hypothetical protein WC851_03810 [Candidatus Shapirobacteria bacterium]|jgi:hypothetical protein